MFSLLLIPFAALPDQAEPADSRIVSDTKRLLVVGDSLSAAYQLLESEGWVSLLANQWQEQELKIEVTNAAISGYTTKGGLERLPRLLAQNQPTHVFLELGGNDGLQGQNIKTMKRNLAKMIELSQRAGAKVILQDMEIPTNYGARYTRMFGDTFEDLAKEYSIPLIPFFLEQIALDKSLMMPDGIHPTKEAQSLIADIMHQQLTPLLVAND